MKSCAAAAMTAFMIFAATAVACACDKNVIYIAQAQNHAIEDYDRYWGYPEDFTKTISYMIAFRLMYETGKTVKVLERSEIHLFGDEDGSMLDIEAAKKLPGVADGCYIVSGIVREAVIDTSRSLKLAFGKKKFDIYSQMHLVLADISTGKTLVSDGYLGRHETSTMPNELWNRDRRQFFPTDPVEAGGNAMGIPFSRISQDFARAVKPVLAN